MFEEEKSKLVELQYPLFIENVRYSGVVETFYFHYGIDFTKLGVFDRPPGLIYTGVPVGNTIGLETILGIVNDGLLFGSDRKEEVIDNDL